MTLEEAKKVWEMYWLHIECIGWTDTQRRIKLFEQWYRTATDEKKSEALDRCRKIKKALEEILPQIQELRKKVQNVAGGKR